MSRRISYEAFNKSLTEQEYGDLVRSEGFDVCLRFGLAKYRVRRPSGRLGDYNYYSYKKSWEIFWASLSFNERMAVRNMPHIDKYVFEEITGIKL